MVYYIASVLFLLLLRVSCAGMDDETAFWPDWQFLTMLDMTTLCLLFTQAPILVWFVGTIFFFLMKNLNAYKPLEHPPSGGEMSKGLD